jgi:hypothetical protein
MNNQVLAHLRRIEGLDQLVYDIVVPPQVLQVKLSEDLLGPNAQDHFYELSVAASLHMHFHIELIEQEAIAVDEGGPFQLWLRKLAQEVFSPLTGLFLPAKNGMIRINPIPLVGCELIWMKYRCKKAGSTTERENIKEQYRYAGRLIGLALRPWKTKHGKQREQPFCLGEPACLIPSLCKYLIKGDRYEPELFDLRLGSYP